MDKSELDLWLALCLVVDDFDVNVIPGKYYTWIRFYNMTPLAPFNQFQDVDISAERRLQGLGIWNMTPSDALTYLEGFINEAS